MRRRFRAAQELWSVIAATPGWLAQVGGWQDDRGRVIGLWADRRYYGAFVRTRRDVVAEQTAQTGTYETIVAAAVEVIFVLHGPLAEQSAAPPRPELLAVREQVHAHLKVPNQSRRPPTMPPSPLRSLVLRRRIA